MLKILLKKEFAAFAAFFLFGGAEKGKKRSVAVVGVSLLIAYALVASVIMFWELADMLCAPYLAMNLDWVYFAFTGTTAMAVGCLGSVFMAKSKLYEAKDNEALLAMPIPTKTILLTRVLSLYLFTLLFTTVAFAPACVRYFTLAGITLPSAVGCLLVTLALPVGVVAVACLLGWLIALITARVPKKNFVTALLLLAFLIGYSVAYSKLQDLLNFVVVNGEQVGGAIRSKLFLFWQLGLGATGKIGSALVFVGIVTLVSALVYWVLSATFLYVVTERHTGKRVKYREGKSQTRPVLVALLSKEGMRYLRNPMILFNAGIGSILCLVLVGYALVDKALVADINAALLPKAEIAFILTLIMLFIVSSNCITASSISLEGENLWLLRSMPVSTAKIFAGKIAFHILFTALPTTLALGVLCILLKIPLHIFLLSWLMLTVATAFFATAGLAVNLKFPNLKWTSEMVAVKQSLSTLLSMFGGWGVGALALGGYFWFGMDVGLWYFAILSAVLAAATALIAWWIKKRGAMIFEQL